MKNVRTTFCRGGHGELTSPKWLDSIKKQKEAMFVTDRQIDRANDKK